MKRLFPVLFLLLTAISVVAQDWKPLTATDPAITSLRKELGTMASIKGNIRQEKSFAFLDDKLVSTGYFIYKKENRLRWQFNEPIEYIILIHDNAMRLREAGEEKQYKGVNKILRQVREIILGCIDGSIIDNPSYKASFSGNSNSLKLEMQPKDRQLKEFIQRIEVEFAKQGNRIRSVRLTDPSGDETHIHFTDIRTGQTIDEAVFTDF